MECCSKSWKFTWRTSAVQPQGWWSTEACVTLNSVEFVRLVHHHLLPCSVVTLVHVDVERSVSGGCFKARCPSQNFLKAPLLVKIRFRVTVCSLTREREQRCLCADMKAPALSDRCRYVAPQPHSVCTQAVHQRERKTGWNLIGRVMQMKPNGTCVLLTVTQQLTRRISVAFCHHSQAASWHDGWRTLAPLLRAPPPDSFAWPWWWKSPSLQQCRCKHTRDTALTATFTNSLSESSTSLTPWGLLVRRLCVRSRWQALQHVSGTGK